MIYRIGIGEDVHEFAEGIPLILGGVKIPHSKGLKGHSDADVLIHAVMDAILGALCEGDIGQHFPDTDPMYKGISGMKLLSIVDKIMINKGFRVNNLDTIIIAQEPKLSSYYQKMKKNLVSALSVESNAVNIKATTTEGLGFTGRKEGIMAKAIVMLHKQ